VDAGCPVVGLTVAQKWTAAVHFCSLWFVSLDTHPARPLRRDAERNRERILAAAREAFAESGLHVGLHEIARRAGVGVGTIYRRFPDKDGLIDALFLDRVEDAVTIAERALEHDDAWEGLVAFLEGTIEVQVADRGLHELVFTGGNGPRCAGHARRRMVPLVARLVARAQEDGTLRPDVTLYDVGLVRESAGRLMEATRDSAPDAWRRHLVLMLDGLRTERTGPTPLPGRPLTEEQFDSVFDR
jgi:AcrR family transcriptional regulator